MLRRSQKIITPLVKIRICFFTRRGGGIILWFRIIENILRKKIYLKKNENLKISIHVFLNISSLLDPLDVF